jgi:photosystem II stability/assembly factor-like uncharacterized protein
MKKIALILFASLCLYCCKTLNYKIYSPENTVFKTIEIDTLFLDKISIRALVLDNNKVWYAANNSRFGFYDLEKKTRFEDHIIKNSSKLEFRSIAKTEKYIYIVSVGNPALLYQISKDRQTTQLVYEENHDKVFYDSMQFWNDSEGITIGDPISDCFSILITRDGGKTWNKISQDNLPKNVDGEAAFAASNTNIVVRGNNTWVVSGGSKARVFYSSDKGKSWNVYNSPITQGKKMTGIFTADFYNANIGYIAGGDYEILDQNFKNKASTEDGGKTWKLVSENQGFGHASCVQYFPNSNGNSLITVGATGIWCSWNKGESWIQLASDPSLLTIRFLNDHTAIAAGSNKMIRINFKK